MKRSFVRPALLTWMLAAAASAHAVGGGCYMVCRTSAGTCEALDGQGRQVGSAKVAESTLLGDCFTLKATRGPQTLVFRSAGKKSEVTVAPQEPYSTALARANHQLLDCLPSDPIGCENRKLVRIDAGKSFDPAAPSEIVGEPCRLGLPCGKVGLRPDGGLTIRLVEPQRGTLSLYPSRGQSGGPITLVFDGTTARLDGGVLKPGETYRYRLQTSTDGPARAAGEFSVLSQRAQKDSDDALRQASTRPAQEREQATIESLLLDGRDWEALELTLERQP